MTKQDIIGGLSSGLAVLVSERDYLFQHWGEPNHAEMWEDVCRRIAGFKLAVESLGLDFATVKQAAYKLTDDREKVARKQQAEAVKKHGIKSHVSNCQQNLHGTNYPCTCPQWNW